MKFELPPYDDGCSFCDNLSGNHECAFIVQNEHAAAEIDGRQDERAAMLVIPRRHRKTVLDIEAQELAASYVLATRVAIAATRALGGNATAQTRSSCP